MQIIYDVVDKSGLNVELILKEKLNTGSIGSYYYLTNHIEISPDSMYGASETFNKDYHMEATAEMIAEMVTAHELGHASDEELVKVNEQIAKEKPIVNESVLLGDMNTFKVSYKKICDLVMKKEIVAWDKAPAFLLSSIDENIWNVYKMYSLATYTVAHRMEFKFYILTHKLFKKIDLYIEKGPKVNVDFQSMLKNNFNAVENRFYIHLPYLLRWRKKEFIHLSTVDYVLFEAYFEYMEQVFTEHKEELDEIEDYLYEYAQNGQDKEMFSQYKQVFIEKSVIQLEFILDKLGTLFWKHPRYTYYYETKLQVMKSSANRMGKVYEDIFQRFNKNNKETA